MVAAASFGASALAAERDKDDKNKEDRKNRKAHATVRVYWSGLDKYTRTNQHNKAQIAWMVEGSCWLYCSAFGRTSTCMQSG